jgi:hypothetical protein
VCLHCIRFCPCVCMRVAVGCRMDQAHGRGSGRWSGLAAATIVDPEQDAVGSPFVVGDMLRRCERAPTLTVHLPGQRVS